MFICVRYDLCFFTRTFLQFCLGGGDEKRSTSHWARTLSVVKREIAAICVSAFS